MTGVDVVVVTYKSAETIADAIEPLAGRRLGERDRRRQRLGRRHCRRCCGRCRSRRSRWRRTAASRTAATSAGAPGSSPYVLFLNPDARIDADALAKLVAELDRDERIGAVAPRIEEPDGSLDYSLRRFPRLRSSFAQALFLHRIFPDATWVDEVIRDPAEYEHPHAVEWVSGACFVVRRTRARGDRRPATRASSTTARTSTSARGSGRPATRCDSCPARARRARGRCLRAADAPAPDPRREPHPLLGEARHGAGRARGAREHRPRRRDARRRSRAAGAARRGHLRALGVALRPLPAEPSRLVRGT